MKKENKINEYLLPLFLIGCFGLLVIFGIHGYSISIWHYFIDGTAADELLLGQPQSIRSDDWGLDLPLAFAQVSHNPKFPIINENIGIGGNILSPIKLASLSPITIFRPSVWGYFFGTDQGMAWCWWYMVFGLFYSCYCMFKIISRGEHRLSFFAAIAVAISPYFRIWAYHKAEIFIGLAFTFVCFCKLITQTQPKKITLWGALMGWAAGCMVFNFMYPPILIVLSLLLLSLFLEYWLNLRQENQTSVPGKSFWFWRILGFTTGALVFGLSIFFIFNDSWDAIKAILNTTYPGHRVSTGGGVPIWPLFADHFFFRFAAPTSGGWGPLINECETASFFVFFPIILPFYFIKFFKDKKSLDWIVITTCLYLSLILAFHWVGIPLWLSQITMLEHSIPNRVFGGIGMANFILLVRYFADVKQGKIKKLEQRNFVMAYSLVLILIIGIGLNEDLPNYQIEYFIYGIVFQLVMLVFLFFPVKGLKWFFLTQSLVSLVYTWNFNPIVKGGSEYIFNNQLTKKIQAIHAKAPKGSKWLVTGAVPKNHFMILDNYMRMIGVPTIGSYQCPPQKEIWAQFFLTPEEINFTNQCAFIYFQSADVPWRIVSNGNGVISVYGRPGDLVLDKLNVRFYLVEGDLNEFDIFFNNTKFRLLDGFQNKRIYERLL